ncbi:hypothetical protein GC174_14690 [bacterium]|nr:hypothetical protein [bacterium]
MSQRSKPFYMIYMKQGRLLSFSFIMMLGYLGYLWWTTTPYHALREIRRSLNMHDQKAFNKYVDVAGIVTTFTDEIIFEPAKNTKDLTKFQRVVGLGALGMARIPINNSMIFQIQKWVQGRPGRKNSGQGEEKSKAMDTVATVPAVPGDQNQNQNQNENENADDDDLIEDDREEALEAIEEAPSFKKALTSEIKFEVDKLKNASLDKMVDYARMHPDTLVNRIFVFPRGKKRNSFRKILAHYGFRRKNIKQVEINQAGDRYVCILHFVNPDSGLDVPIHFELRREGSDLLDHYRVKRILKVKETFALLGEDTDKQVHGLVSHGLQGLSFQSAVEETRDFFKRVRKKAAGDE